MALPQIDVARAAAFVRAHGSAVDVARLEGILGREEPDRSVVKALEGVQNRDGGFPALAVSRRGAPGLGAGAAPELAVGPDQAPDALPGPQETAAASSVAATCTLLAWLRDIPPLAGSPMAGRAVSFVRRSQQVDGSWVEPGHSAGAPSPEHVTALAAYTLLVMEPEHPDPIVRSARWLRAALNGGPERADSPTLIFAAALWSRPPVGAPVDPGAEALRSLLRGRALTAGELTLWLTTFVELGLEARHLGLAVELLERLAGLQEPDGGWPAEGAHRVEATLGALRAFRGFGLIAPG